MSKVVERVRRTAVLHLQTELALMHLVPLRPFEE